MKIKALSYVLEKVILGKEAKVNKIPGPGIFARINSNICPRAWDKIYY